MKDSDTIRGRKEATVARCRELGEDPFEVIAEAGNRDIIKSNPYVDCGIFFSVREFYYDHPAFNELMYTVKNKAYDACFLFNQHVTPLNLLLAGVTGAPLRVSFAGRSLMPFINVGIRPKKETVYEGDKYE